MSARAVTVCLLWSVVGCQQPSAAAQLSYGVEFSARFVPAQRVVEASITVTQDAGELRALELAAPSSRFSDFVGDGEIETLDDHVRWLVPRPGGALRYRVNVDHVRNGAYDARLTDKWAIFRLGDLFPPAKARSRKGAESTSTLVLQGPTDWSYETRYGSAGRVRAVDDPERRFDRPTGWAAVGELGVRRDTIADRHIVVAAPQAEKVADQFRRLDTLAFLQWTLPRFVEVFPDFPARLLIVGASNGMWRGGLSGPGSLYVHADRPLISENGTSALLHELVHVATSAPASASDDWVVEGLAEYYGLEILRRTGGISQRRFDRAIGELEEWVEREDGGPTQPSTGANTAWAVLKFHALAGELNRSGGSLDAIVRELSHVRMLNRRALSNHVERAIGRASRTLADIPD